VIGPALLARASVGEFFFRLSRFDLARVGGLSVTFFGGRSILHALLLGTVLLAGIAPALGSELLIENVAIVSPELSQASGPRNLLIRNGRIASISDKPIAEPKAQHVNGRGRYLVPGVMDSHVHVSDAVGLPYVTSDLDIAALRAAYFQQQPRSYLYFGVTQVLDTIGDPESSAAFESQPQHPDLFRCGGAPVLNGYPTALIDPSVRYKIMPNWIFEPANAKEHPLPPGADAKEHTPEAVVSRIASSGARCVKVFIEDGFGARTGWPLMSEQTLQRLHSAARAKGLMVLGHANALDHQQRALAGRVDVLAHGLWHWGESNAAEGVPPPIANHLRAIHQRSIGYQPTLRVIYGEADLFRADTLKDPTYAKVVPPALLQWYGTEAGQWFKREMKADSGDPPDAKMMQMELQVGSRNLRAAKFLHDLGHPLLLASDTPSGPIYGNQPGYDTYREMRAMAQAGIPLDAIFRAATINNAKQFGLERDYGTVQVGKVANLVLLKANPLETLRAWSAIEKIVLHGEVIEREALAADRLSP
jgi:imidazolonepropionase-like amidohydrolase